jgi:hypothetical protein
LLSRRCKDDEEAAKKEAMAREEKVLVLREV